jgi:hypothetical protein
MVALSGGAKAGLGRARAKNVHARGAPSKRWAAHLDRRRLGDARQQRLELRRCAAGGGAACPARAAVAACPARAAAAAALVRAAGAAVARLWREAAIGALQQLRVDAEAAQPTAEAAEHAVAEEGKGLAREEGGILEWVKKAREVC